jgi:hypothetical protein
MTELTSAPASHKMYSCSCKVRSRRRRPRPCVSPGRSNNGRRGSDGNAVTAVTPRSGGSQRYQRFRSLTGSPTASSQQPTIKTLNPRMSGLTLTTFTSSIINHRIASCLQRCLEKRTTHRSPASTLTRYADRCSGRYLLSASTYPQSCV